MKGPRGLWIAALVLLLLSGCGGPAVPPTAPPSIPPPTVVPEGTTDLSPSQALSATLGSLVRLDDYPLYMMHYQGDYDLESLLSDGRLPGVSQGPAWGCSLFAALGDPRHMVYGRNFDWHYSPALLLFTDPADGYASVSMVDLSYLVQADSAGELDTLPLDQRQALLSAPFLPFDGMNERGLVVGMAAVPESDMPHQAAAPTLDSLVMIRLLLDRAGSVDEAVDLLGRYNIDWGGGPPLHYLLADASGRAVLVEFYEGDMVLLHNKKPWHQATNYLRSAAEEADGQCWRYDAITRRLQEGQGQLSTEQVLELLSQVSQDNTQWSVVYEINMGRVNVVMGREYEQVYTLSLGYTFR